MITPSEVIAELTRIRLATTVMMLTEAGIPEAQIAQRLHLPKRRVKRLATQAKSARSRVCEVLLRRWIGEISYEQMFELLTAKTFTSGFVPESDGTAHDPWRRGTVDELLYCALDGRGLLSFADFDFLRDDLNVIPHWREHGGQDGDATNEPLPEPVFTAERRAYAADKLAEMDKDVRTVWTVVFERASGETDQDTMVSELVMLGRTDDIQSLLDEAVEDRVWLSGREWVMIVMILDTGHG